MTPWLIKDIFNFYL